MRKILLFVILALISVGMLSGCAGIEIAKVTKKNKDKLQGFRYYRPHPYLLVTYDPNGNPNGEILWLPNMNEEYAIKANSNFGKVELNLNFADGWNLTQVGQKSDSQVAETIQAFTGVLKEAAASKLLKTKPGKAPVGPRLYRIHFDPDKGYVNKLKLIKVD